MDQPDPAPPERPLRTGKYAPGLPESRLKRERRPPAFVSRRYAGETVKRLLVLIVPFTGLSGCGRNIDLQDATVDQFSTAVRGLQLQKPGRWTVESRVTTMDLGATDAAMTSMIRDKVMQPRTLSICIRKDRPGMMSLDEMQAIRTMACRVPRFVVKKGMIDGRITCTDRDRTLNMEEHGHYTAETYDLDLSVRQAVPGQPTLTTATKISARRIGDCND